MLRESAVTHDFRIDASVPEFEAAFGTSNEFDLRPANQLPEGVDRIDVGGNAINFKLACYDCHIHGRADVHVLFRTGQYSPFEETWSWGDVCGINVDVVLLSVELEREFEFEGFRICLPPIC